MVQRPHLRDGDADGVLDRQGYVVLRGGARGLVRSLRSVHRRLVGPVAPGFTATLYSSDQELKEDVNRSVSAVVAPLLAELFDGHELLLASFVTKGRCPSGAGAMPPHQDWTFVDERAASSLNVWIPLTSVDDRNGAISVLPGGHRLPYTLRGTDSVNAFHEVEGLAIAQMVQLPMEAGDVLVHDHRVLHASPPNRRRQPRLVAGCGLIPAGAERVHYRQVGPTRFERYRVEPDFFTQHTFSSGQFPPSARLAEIVDFEQPVIDASDLRRLDEEVRHAS